MYNSACMRRKHYLRGDAAYASGVITVFFTMLSVLYLGVIFALIESVRFQGARVQSACIVDMGNTSVFGEYEKKLLEDYEIFALDGAYGSGDFSVGRVEDRMTGYMKRSAESSSLAGIFLFDPWGSSIDSVNVEKYTLLTDENGEAFYQEAVAYMRQTAIMQVSADLISFYRDAEDAEEKQKTFEEHKSGSDEAMEQVEQAEKERREELEETASSSDELADGLIEEENAQPAVEGPEMENPLPALARIARQDILSLTCPGKTISEGRAGAFELAFSRWGRKKGNLPVRKVNSGLLSDLVFREYLLDHFPDWSQSAESGDLRYGIEYIICGHKSDRENLKGTVRRLLLIREGCNYAYAAADAGMNAKCGEAAALIIGWLGIPVLTTAVQHALLLGWSYGESLLDVRTLMDGGNVPLMKHAGEWELGLDKLADLEGLLRQGRSSRERGLSYRGYLRILLNLQWIATQKKRGLDLLEMYIRKTPGLSNFRADYCIVEIRDKAEFTVPELFGRVSRLWLGRGSDTLTLSIKGGYSYMD